MNQNTAGGSVAFWQIEILSFAHQDLNEVFPELVSQYRCGPVTVDWTACLKSATFLFSVRFPPTSMEYRKEYGIVNGKHIHPKGDGVGKKKKRGKNILKDRWREKIAISNRKKFNLKGVSKQK